jgi:hypothetical protein
LRAEADLFAAFTDFAGELSCSETMWLVEMPNLDALIADWRSVSVKLDSWRKEWNPTGES